MHLRHFSPSDQWLMVPVTWMHIYKIIHNKDFLTSQNMMVEFHLSHAEDHNGSKCSVVTLLYCRKPKKCLCPVGMFQTCLLFEVLFSETSGHYCVKGIPTSVPPLYATVPLSQNPTFHDKPHQLNCSCFFICLHWYQFHWSCPTSMHHTLLFYTKIEFTSQPLNLLH